MAHPVVDRLEVVEVDEQHGERCRVTVVIERVSGQLDEQSAVGETGEGIVQGLVPELTLQLLSISNVATVQNDSLDGRIVA